MSKHGFSSALIILVGVLVLGVLSYSFLNIKSSPPVKQACTLEAKLCPDGSAVGRTGPNCEFAPCPTSSSKSQVHYHANFEIYTNGTKRTFTDAMYHNQSEDVFVEAKLPSEVHVHKDQTTWGDFFETLPFSLTETCLTTGTSQTFCTGESGTLSFYLDGKEAPNALNTIIAPGVLLVVRYE